MSTYNYVDMYDMYVFVHTTYICMGVCIMYEYAVMYSMYVCKYI